MPFASFLQVKTPVMLNIGLKDLRVPPSQGLEYYKMLKARGVPVRWVSVLGCLCQLFDCSIITWLFDCSIITWLFDCSIIRWFFDCSIITRFDCSIITRFLWLFHHHMVLCLCSIITRFLWLFHHHKISLTVLSLQDFFDCSIITWFFVLSSQGFFDCSIITRFLWLFHHHKISLTVLSSQGFFDCSIITWFFDSVLSSIFLDCSIITRFFWLFYHHKIFFYSSIITRIFFDCYFFGTVLSQDFFDCSIITRVGMSQDAGKHVGLPLSSERLLYAALCLSSTHSPHSTLTRGWKLKKLKGGEGAGGQS